MSLMPKKSIKKSLPQEVSKVSKNLPSSVKIGYRNIQIKYVRPDFKSDDMTESYGEYRAREGVILLQHDLCGQEMANSLWHEIKHAAVYVSGLNQANGPLKEDDAEEIVVNNLSNFEIGIFIDNPWLIDFIKNNMHKSKDAV